MKIINRENVPENANPDQMVDKEGTTHGPVETIPEVDANPIEITKVKRDAHVRTHAEIIDRTNANSTTDRAAIAEIDQIPVADHATNVMAWATSYCNVPVHTGTEKMDQ